MEAFPEGVTIDASGSTRRPAALRHLGCGWDADVFVWLDEDEPSSSSPSSHEPTLTVRFSRTAGARDGMENERAMLPVVAAALAARGHHGLPKPVASARLVANATRAEDRLVLVQTYVRGKSLVEIEAQGALARARAEPEGATPHRDLTRLASSLGRAVRALHEVPLALVTGLPVDPLGRLDVGRRLEPARVRVRALVASGELTIGQGNVLDEILRSPPETPPPGALGEEDAVLLHADLHTGNVLVDEQGALSGVVDWVDLTRGARAVDLAVPFEVLPATLWPTFLDAYGRDQVDIVTLAWARWRALTHLLVCLPLPVPDAPIGVDPNPAFEGLVRRQLVEMAKESVAVGPV